MLGFNSIGCFPIVCTILARLNHCKVFLEAYISVPLFYHKHKKKYLFNKNLTYVGDTMDVDDHPGDHMYGNNTAVEHINWNDVRSRISKILVIY